ncbi:hypothetical protein COMA2_170011 [Candidatus Nitrospira nitrificans]|uniref:Uncharacterized protein n=1 Tax=Candidatus Nitrospira nitrificans TaxID=1742973 RepID=A0A0S4L9S5_9BACT|nr:hypothetical protein COMA2_170011 [Candidatus Nitrospira nitrificans]
MFLRLHSLIDRSCDMSQLLTAAVLDQQMPANQIRQAGAVFQPIMP